MQKLSVLQTIDSEINKCHKKMYYLRTVHPELGKYQSLYTKLRRIEKKSHIHEIQPLLDICFAFFDSESKFQIDRTSGSVCINVFANAFGEYQGFSKCEIDPYVANTLPYRPMDPQPREASISFLMDGQEKWKNIFFITSFDLVNLLCTHFLPDDAEKRVLLTYLDREYTESEELQRKREAEAREKIQTERRRLEIAFEEEISESEEFKAFKDAFQRIRQKDAYKKGFSIWEAQALMKKLIDTHIY